MKAKISPYQISFNQNKQVIKTSALRSSQIPAASNRQV